MAEHHAASRAISERLNELLAMLAPKVLGAYWPIRREFSPIALLRDYQSDGVVALPVVVAKNEPLQFRQWTHDCPMATGVYNIPYPADGAAVVQPDTLLIPMLGFDAAGYRLGYGGGYYDRTVAAAVPRPRLIGISFEFARMPSIRPLSHDVPMDWVVTEKGTYPASQSVASAAKPIPG